MPANMLENSAKHSTYTSYESYPLAQRTVVAYALANDYDKFLESFPAREERPDCDIQHYFKRLDADTPEVWVEASRVVRFTKVLLAMKASQNQLEATLFSAGLLAAARPYEDANEYVSHRISGFNPLRPFAGQLPEGSVLAVNLGAYLSWAFRAVFVSGLAYSNFRWLLGGAIACVRRMPTMFGQTAMSSNASDFTVLTADENSFWLHLPTVSTLDIASFMVACSYYTADAIDNQPIWTFHQERPKNPDIWKAVAVANLDSHKNRSVANTLAKCLVGGDFHISMPELLHPQEFSRDKTAHTTGDYNSVRLQDRVRGCDIPDIPKMQERKARMTFKQRVAALSDEMIASGISVAVRGTRKPVDPVKQEKSRKNYKQALQVMQDMGFNHRERTYEQAVALVEAQPEPVVEVVKTDKPDTISDLMKAAKDIFLVPEEVKTNAEEVRAGLLVRLGTLPDDLYITPEGYAVSNSPGWITATDFLTHENGEFVIQHDKKVPIKFTTPATESNHAIALMRQQRDMVPGQLQPFGICPITGRRNKGDTVTFTMNGEAQDIRMPRDYDPEIGAPMCGTETVEVTLEDFDNEAFPYREAYIWAKGRDGKCYRKLKINSLPDFTKPTQEWFNIEQIRCLPVDTAYFEDCVNAMLTILEENPLYLSDNDKQIIDATVDRIEKHKAKVKSDLAYEAEKKAFDELGDEPLF